METIADELLSACLRGEADTDIEPGALEDALDDQRDGPLVCALLMESPDLLDEFADAVSRLPEPGSSSLPRRLAVAATLEHPDTDDRIDEWLADPERAGVAVDALLRAGIDWYHPGLTDLLEDRSAGFGAAWLLATSAPDELEEALEAVDSDSRRIELMRAAAAAGSAEWFSALLQWREHIGDDLSNRHLAYLDGALATISPLDYARELLMAEVGDDWLGDDRAVADFLSRHGTTTWVSSLAVFRHVRDVAAFELAATFAVASAVTSPFDDVDTDDLAPDTAPRWLDVAPSRVSVPMALTEEPELTELLVESTLHQLLLERGVTPAAISGLPLSGPSVDPKLLDELFEPFSELSDDEPRARVQLVRTLLDLLSMVRRGDCDREVASPIFERFSSHSDAAKLVKTLFDDRQPVGNHGDWGCRGLDAIAWQFDRRADQSLPALANGWFEAPPERSAAWRSGFAGILTAARTGYSDRG